jgi:pyrimidine operon attenuation protein/uracil phosphoribosyltransferase
MSELLNAAALDKGITQLAETITATQGDFSQAAIVGIHTRGVLLAKRLLTKLSPKFGEIPFGTLDINLYRDDLSKISYHPVIKETRIEFPIDGKVIYLVDDVLFTGRTIRAAMDAIFDLGRPKAIKLVVAAVRDGRELPIEADFNIIIVATKEGDNVKVKFNEVDGSDGIELKAHV